MTGLDSGVNNNINTNNTLESLSSEELKKQYFELRDKNDPDSKKIFQEIENEMIRRLDWEKNQTNTIPEEPTKKRLDEFFADKKTNRLSKGKKEELYNLILEEIKNAKTPDEETKKQIDDKQSEIDRLTKLLDDEKKSTHEMLTDTPSLKEYFSLERRRRAGMLKKFDEFKKDTTHYPKNLLIYAMGITDSKIFWIRQKLKKGRITLAWKWKEDDIVTNLNIMLDKTKSDPNEKSKWKAAIKKALYKELQLALESHKEKLIKQNTLPDYK